MNIKFYYAYKLFKDTMPIYPVYLLMFKANGLSLTQISFLLAIWSLSVVLLEIPTGVLADHWSRKNMLIIGGLCKAIGYISWFFSESFALFALGFILWGISESFCSGSEEALLYDNLKIKNQEEVFGNTYGKGNFYSSMGVALSCLTGGFLTSLLTYKGVLLLSVFFVIVSILLATKFREVNYFRMKNADKPEDDHSNPFVTLVDATFLCVRNKKLLTVILLLVLVIGTAGILDEYDQIIAHSYNLNLGIIGVWISIRYMLEAIGAKFAYLFRLMFSRIGIKSDFYTVCMVCITAGVLLLVFGIGNSVILIPLYGFFYMLMASAGVLQEEYVQHTIDEQGRSTVHSVISFMHNMYGILFFCLVGLSISKVSIHLGITVISIYMLILSVLLYLKYRIYTRA